MRIKVIIGRGKYDDAGIARDACWIEYQDVQEVLTKCQFQDPKCSLAWCGDRSSENHHMARKLHMRGLISDQDIHDDPLSGRVKYLLRDELEASGKSLEIAPNTQDLNGVRVFESKNQWRKTWFRDEARSWAYDGSPSDPSVQKALEEAAHSEATGLSSEPATAGQQADTVSP